MRLTSTAALILGLFTSACASFPQYRIGRVPSPIKIDDCSSDRALHIEIQYGNDERLRNRAMPQFLKQATQRVSEDVKACFSDITVSTGPSVDPEGLHLKLSLQLHNNVVKEGVVGFVSGFSSFLLPVWCTYPYTLTASVVGSQIKEIDPVVLNDSVRLYMHAVLLLYPKTPSSAIREMYENMVRDVFRKIDWKTVSK